MGEKKCAPILYEKCQVKYNLIRVSLKYKTLRKVFVEQSICSTHVSMKRTTMIKVV